MKSWAQRETGFTILLVLLASGLVLSGLMEADSMGRFWVKLVIFVAMLAAVWGLVSVRWVAVLASACAVANLGITAAALGAASKDWSVAAHATAIAFLITVAAVITRRVWGAGAVSTDTIVGGIAVYVTVGVIFASAYQLLEFVAPGSFVVSAPAVGAWGAWEPTPGHYPRLLFFSFVTLTTLGYGDVVPASPLAAVLAAAEAVVGPLYLTVLIARLVGLHVAGARGDPGGPGAGESPRSG